MNRREFLIGGVTLAGASVCSAGEKRAPAAPRDAPWPPAAEAETEITLWVNGERQDLRIDPRTTLLDLLRERLALTGTKKGCDMGQCGACTVLADGVRIDSCLALAMQYDGRRLTTIEGLARGELHPLQTAFIERDALQCGYCTPGQILSGIGFCHESWGPKDDDVRAGMSGNLCRCGAYPHILEALQDVRGKI
jgi:xanthine dehydrogenase YagT iron-sulfur-binding subunit